MSNWRFSYDSLGAFLRAAGGRSELPDGRRASRSVDGDFERFSETENYRQAVRLAEYGWSSGAARAARLMDRIEAAAVQAAAVAPAGRAIVTGPVGHAPVVPAYIAGRPDDMLRWTGTAERPVVRVAVNNSHVCTAKAENIIRRGAAVAALIQALQARGYAVAVDAVFTVTSEPSGRGSRSYMTVALHRPEHPLDVDRLAFALAHPAMLRRLVFSWMECQPKEYRRTFHVVDTGGYGYPAELPEADAGQYDIVVPKIDKREFADDMAAARWLNSQLQALEVAR